MSTLVVVICTIKIEKNGKEHKLTNMSQHLLLLSQSQFNKKIIEKDFQYKTQ